MDGISSVDGTTNDNILLMIACQHKNDLDDALLRPGRIQHHYKLHLPNKSDLLAMFHRKLYIINENENINENPQNENFRNDINNTFTDRITCDSDVNIELLVDKLFELQSNPTGSMVTSICNKAIYECIREYSMSDMKNKCDKVCWRHFLVVLQEF